MEGALVTASATPRTPSDSHTKQPKPRTERYNDLITYIRRGYYKIPKFQRDFVWSIEDTAKLFDSIVKGYPIGTFILWKTRERLASVKDLGGADLPATPEGDAVVYILDGQQRLASLFVALGGLQASRDGKLMDYRELYVALDEPTDSEEPIVTSQAPAGKSVRLCDLLSPNIRALVENYRDYIEKIQYYRDRFTTYDFSTIVLEDYPIDAAVEVFTRINTTGTELTLFEIMSAKTYEESKGFDLRAKWDKFNEELSLIGYDTISSSTMLQCVSANLVGDCTRPTILKLDKDDIINVWDDTVTSVKHVVDHFRTSLHIPVSRLLPFNALVVPFSYFFFKRRGRPSAEQANQLQQYFWMASLSYRYSAAAETRIGQDIKRIERILDGQQPEYDFRDERVDTDEVEERWFSTGDSYCKAVLCLLAGLKPRSFDTNGDVVLDNTWLVQSNSKNYHHFFPRAYLRRTHQEPENSVVNITLVDDHLNKREIRDQAPSVYMKRFNDANPSLEETMKTHLIDDLTSFGVWDDEYETFLQQRSDRIVEELNRRIGL